MLPSRRPTPDEPPVPGVRWRMAERRRRQGRSNLCFPVGRCPAAFHDSQHSRSHPRCSRPGSQRRDSPKTCGQRCRDRVSSARRRRGGYRTSRPSPPGTEQQQGQPHSPCHRRADMSAGRESSQVQLGSTVHPAHSECPSPTSTYTAVGGRLLDLAAAGTPAARGRRASRHRLAIPAPGSPPGTSGKGRVWMQQMRAPGRNGSSDSTVGRYRQWPAVRRGHRSIHRSIPPSQAPVAPGAHRHLPSVAPRKKEGGGGRRPHRTRLSDSGSAGRVRAGSASDKAAEAFSFRVPVCAEPC